VELSLGLVCHGTHARPPTLTTNVKIGAYDLLMRAGRLVAVLLHIQRHGGRSTAPELARALEVSVRTIYRDITALQEAGVPLWTEPGASGGVRLVDGWEFPLDGLSS